MPSPLTITAANLLPTSTTLKATGIAGGTITAGMPVYIDTSVNTLKAADANGSGTDIKTVAGISLHAALAGQPLTYATGGDLAFGAILTAGIVYVNGAAAAGDINPSADLASGWTTSILGVATTTSNLKINIFNSGAALA